jgi:hypothetical protein
MKISMFIVVLSATLGLSEAVALSLSSMLVGGEHVEKAGRSLCNRRGFVSIVSFGTAVLSKNILLKLTMQKLHLMLLLRMKKHFLEER